MNFLIFIGVTVLTVLNGVQSVPCRPKASVCIPTDLIEGLMSPTIDFETSAREFAEHLRSAGIQVATSEPGGFFFLNGGVDTETQQRYVDGDELVRLTQLVRNTASLRTDGIMSREEFIEWLEDQASCDQPDIANFCSTRDTLVCDVQASWRTYDGTCNNFLKPYQGAYQTEFSRALRAVYDDDVYSIRKSVSGEELPSARLIGTHVFEKTDNTITEPPVAEVMPNNGAVIYGQTIVHDFALQSMKHAGAPGPGIQCCTQNREQILQPDLASPGCLAIRVPRDDDVFAVHNITCMNFIRSQTVPKPDCSFTTAEQVNIVSHYIDGSFVYGSTQEQGDSMRAFSDGQFLMNGNILPPNAAGTGFTSGDGRFGQTSQLAFFHSIYYREHNRIAALLTEMNPNWDDERTFQETRRIIVAMIQHSTYDEWLPIFVGEDVAVNENLVCRDELYCDCYNPETDGSCINEFTTGPGRLFHLFVPDHFNLVNADDEVESLRLSSIFGNTNILVNGYDDVARGLMKQHMNFGKFPMELMDFMFRGQNEMGLDLLAMDIQRGRDHGLPAYTAFREKCGGSAINSFDDLAPIVSTANIDKLRQVYENVHDIDMLVGMGVEEFEGWLTPTMNCLFVEQFKRFKCGDSFYYAGSDTRNPFTPEQLTVIKSDSFSRMACENTDLTSAPLNAFQTPGDGNEDMSCDSFPEFDLEPWRE